MARWTSIRTTLWTTAASTFCLAAATFAGPLNRALVDRDASWIVHIDVEAGQRSSLSSWVIKNVPPQELAKVEEFKKKFGLAPGDVKGVTIYGFDLQDDGLAVLTTTGAADELSVRLPEAGLEEFKARVDGNVHYFSFKLEGKSWQVGVRPAGPERLVLVAANSAALERGLKVVSGTSPNITADANQAANVVATAQAEKGSIVFAVLRDVGNQRHMNAQMLRNTKTLVVDFGETQENAREFFTIMTVTADNAKVAKEMGQTLQGMIAFGTMLARNNEIPGIVESLEGVKLTVNDDKVVIVGREASEKVLKKLDQIKVMIEAEMKAEDERRSSKVLKETGGGATTGGKKEAASPKTP